MLTARQIALSRGQKLLFSEADFAFYPGDKIGIIGRNGSGKSSLFALILGQLTPDSGEFNLLSTTRLSSLAQHIPDSDETALDYVLSGDEDYCYWQNKLKTAVHEEIAVCHEHLLQMQAYAKPALAASILHGLGFSYEEQSQTLRSFSGGWRMRLGLARCLMKPADLYLLDEPTNHLDLEAIFWLEKWIKQLNAAVLIISHDRDFLDATVTKILHLDQQKFKIYSGHYSFFEKARLMHLEQQQHAYDKQQAKLKHLMSYVERFRAQATKAKQAQSRLKAIERMQLLPELADEHSFSFEFLTSKAVHHQLLKCNHLNIGYPGSEDLIEDIQWIVHSHDRIGLLGKNGQGKSSFIKTLVQDIKPASGIIEYAKDLVIGYFAQHQIEQLDMRLSPIDTILAMDPKANLQTIRGFLGGFLFSGDMATQSIQHFSGGEKARLALARLVWQKPHLLLLDEPSNHLDLELRAAIEWALQSYHGAVILISHDRHLLNTCVNDFYLIHDKKMTLFEGDLEDYQQWLAQTDKSAVQEKKVEKLDYKQQKNIQNQLKRLETEMDALAKKINNYHHELADEALYQMAEQDKLARLQMSLSDAEAQLQTIEQDWLRITEILESK